MSGSAGAEALGRIDAVVLRMLSDRNVRRIEPPRQDYITDVRYALGKGEIEFLHGPPEFHVELLVHVPRLDGSFAKFDLAGLFQVPGIRDWAMRMKLDSTDPDRVTRETEWLVSLVQQLADKPDFSPLFPPTEKG